MSKPRKLCIFCDGFPVTKEHMWADWLRNYIPRTVSKYYSQSGILYPTTLDAKTALHSGDPHSSRIRCVCGVCNSGWMSAVQSETKPILIQLLRGERCTLGKRDQAVLAAWIAMFTMVAEFRFRTGDLSAISTNERRQFMKTQRPPPNWKIWIGALGDDSWKGRYYHRTLPIYSPEDVVKRTVNGVLVPNTQTTTFVVNKLYVHVLSSSVIEVDRQKIDSRLVQRIWPLLAKINWPPRFLSPGDAEWISSAFFQGAIERSVL